MRHFGNSDVVTLKPRKEANRTCTDAKGNVWELFNGYWQFTDAKGAKYSLVDTDMQAIRAKEAA